MPWLPVPVLSGVVGDVEYRLAMSSTGGVSRRRCKAVLRVPEARARRKVLGKEGFNGFRQVRLPVLVWRMSLANWMVGGACRSMP